MIDSLNELYVLGVENDAESHIDIILESLPDSFNNFKLNYNMNKMSLTLAELSNQLVAAKGIIKKPTANMTEKSYVMTKPKGKCRRGKKKWVPKGQKVENGPNGGVVKANKGTGAKPKGKCFHCSMTGHCKRNCPNFLSKEKTASMIETLVSEISFATSTSKS